MNIFQRLALAATVIALIVFAPAAHASSERVDPSTRPDGSEMSVEIDQFDNGTLYSEEVHHRRPTRGISETRQSRRKKTPLKNISTSVYSNFRSKYVTYGVAASESWVWQPSASIEWYGLGFNVWGNFVLADIPDQGRFNEIDLTLYYNFEIEGLTIHPYFTAWVYPTSNKLSLDFSSDTDLLPCIHIAYSIGPLSFFTDLQVYVHPNPGALRGEVGVGLTHKLPFHLAIRTSAIMGYANRTYNRSSFNISDTTVNFFTYNLSFPWNPIEGFVVNPNIHVSTFFQQKFRDAVRYPVLVWGGVDFAYNF